MFATPAERMKAALIEYETLSECQHENIVQLYDCIAHPNGDWFIRMECVPVRFNF